MKQLIDLHFKIISAIQAVMILITTYSTINTNLILGWNWLWFFISMTPMALFLFHSYRLFKFHKHSATLALFFWGLQSFGIKSETLSFKFYAGIAFPLNLKIGSILIAINIVALFLFLWLLFLYIVQKQSNIKDSTEHIIEEPDTAMNIDV